MKTFWARGGARIPRALPLRSATVNRQPQRSSDLIYYRPHPKDGEGTVFTGVCLSTPRYPIQSLILQTTGPMSFLGGVEVVPHLHAIIFHCSQVTFPGEYSGQVKSQVRMREYSQASSQVRIRRYPRVCPPVQVRSQVRIGGGGGSTAEYPHQGQVTGQDRVTVLHGIPLSELDRVLPHPGQNSRSTRYTAGHMPLAFAQNFLVTYYTVEFRFKLRLVCRCCFLATKQYSYTFLKCELLH